jgi:hypothetical protein
MSHSVHAIGGSFFMQILPPLKHQLSRCWSLPHSAI